jgi:hypothetical protein
MKMKIRGAMHGHPSVTLASRFDPVRFSTRLEGGASAGVGEIAVGLNEIPLRLRIPFLKRRHRLLTIGTLGPVRLKFDPLHVSLREISFAAEGVLGGKEGLSVVSEGKMACQTDFHAEGVAGGGFGLGPFRLESEPEPSKTSS